MQLKLTTSFVDTPIDLKYIVIWINRDNEVRFK